MAPNYSMVLRLAITHTLTLQHNMATVVDKAAILDAYKEVMADGNNVDW